MLFTEFLKSLKGCRHEKVRIESNGAYCPDCGQFVVVNGISSDALAAVSKELLILILTTMLNL